MIFPVNASLLDAVVLSVIEEEDTYGYKITQEVNSIINISESTLYPVLRRLQKNADLEVYDMEYLGRNRRYYKITDKGKDLLRVYKDEWIEYKNKIDKVLSYEIDGADKDDTDIDTSVPSNYAEAEQKLKVSAIPPKDEFFDTLELCDEIERSTANFFDKKKAEESISKQGEDSDTEKNNTEAVIQ